MADKLNSVKEMLVTVGLHGFGMRAYTRFEELLPHYQYLFTHFTPRLNAALVADDPLFEVERFAAGERTEAITTEHTEEFIRELERDRIAYAKIPFLRNSSFYSFLFVDDGPGIGGPIPDLINAFKADNPDWTL